MLCLKQILLRQAFCYWQNTDRLLLYKYSHYKGTQIINTLYIYWNTKLLYKHTYQKPISSDLLLITIWQMVQRSIKNSIISFRTSLKKKNEWGSQIHYLHIQQHVQLTTLLTEIHLLFILFQHMLILWE